MLAIWNNFCGYIQISYHRLLWVYVFACIVYLLVRMTSSKGTKIEVLGAEREPVSVKAS